MAGIPLRAAGKLFSRGERTAMLFAGGERHLTLRLGFVLQGTEDILLPDSLLDDWGHEISTVDLYQWIRDNGPHFPRAEVFGFDLLGLSQQCFIRELDLTAKFACYVYEGAKAPIKSGLPLTDIILSVSESGPSCQVEAPATIAFPLSAASIVWWSVDPTSPEGLDKLIFNLLANDLPA
jgi:hypothetical protein